MRYPLAMDLRPSRAVMTSVVAAHGAAALAFFHVLSARTAGFELGPLTVSLPAMQVFCCVVLAVSLVAGLRAESGKRAMRLMLVDDGTLVCESSPRDGRYRLENGAVDFGWAVWVRLRAESGDPAPESSLRGRRWSLMLIRSNVGAECWRGLRTWLRHKAYRSPGG